jgi:hypothetical protein
MRVIYIAGTSHSGSTLLDLMLNAHPAIFASGELLKLNRQLTIRKSRKGTLAPCSCGAPSLHDCRLWSAVDRRAIETSGKPLTELDMLDYAKVGQAAPNTVVFKAIADVSGASFVVDSSKLPGRLSYLMQLKELDVYPVHLVREPKGQINSVMRKHGGFLKHIVRYAVVHEQIRRLLKSVPHSVVHYEDLVRDPQATLRTILHPLGLDFDPRQLAWAEAEKHEIAGNNMRFDASSELILDDAWRHGLSPLKQRAVDFATLLSRRTLPKTGAVR